MADARTSGSAGVTPRAMAVTGYANPAYAESLAEFGSPRILSRSGGSILKRRIPGTDAFDAMGCYPLFACGDWLRLHDDLPELAEELVSLALVVDPFAACPIPYLTDCFQDVVLPFKEHFVVDLGRPVDTFIAPHHRRNSSRALGQVQVERCASPDASLDEWVVLYRALTERHGITGIAAFSQESFARQLRVPGIVAFRAVHEGATIGMLLWYVQADVAYYHLGAHSARGYAVGGSFALFWSAIQYFAEAGLKWLNLGAGAGVAGDGAGGLTRFKRGWSTGTRTAYFCGRIFDRRRYAEITAAGGGAPGNIFPAYRRW